jgi:predicted nucleic acid-binding protein
MIDLGSGVFVDSNVFVYRLDTSEPEKAPVADRWVAAIWERRSGRVSSQVLSEVYVNLTSKLSPGLEREEAGRYVSALFAWRPVSVDARLVRSAFSIQDRYGLSWWDALIVAAARRAACPYLLSEDLQAGQDFDGTQVVNPFEAPVPGL